MSNPGVECITYILVFNLWFGSRAACLFVSKSSLLSHLSAESLGKQKAHATNEHFENCQSVAVERVVVKSHF